MAENKVSGLDGFPPLFFERYWPIIQVEVVEAVRKYFATSEILTSWIRTFITLVMRSWMLWSQAITNLLACVLI